MTFVASRGTSIQSQSPDAGLSMFITDITVIEPMTRTKLRPGRLHWTQRDMRHTRQPHSLILVNHWYTYVAYAVVVTPPTCLPD
jgi:hypothetical protein